MQSLVWSQVPVPLGWSNCEPIINVRASLSRTQSCHLSQPASCQCKIYSPQSGSRLAWDPVHWYSDATCGTWISISGAPRECFPSLSFGWVRVRHLPPTCCVVSFLRGHSFPHLSPETKNTVWRLSTCQGLSLVIMSQCYFKLCWRAPVKSFCFSPDRVEMLLEVTPSYPVW